MLKLPVEEQKKRHTEKKAFLSKIAKRNIAFGQSRLSVYGCMREVFVKNYCIMRKILQVQ